MSGARQLADSAVEDYLKSIYAHTEWQTDPITPKQLAARLGLAPSSVTEMVRKLAAAGLVSHRPYGAVNLTTDGRARATQVVRRHRLIETWLVEAHDYDWADVHDEAEVLEHAISDRLLDSIDRQLGHPIRDPHGDPIPFVDGRVHIPDSVALSELAEGASGAVVRISDRDPGLLREFAAISLRVGASVAVLDIVDDAVRLAVDDVERHVDRTHAAAVRVATTGHDSRVA